MEHFQGVVAAEKPGWEWMYVPPEVRENYGSYHRFAQLELGASELDWDGPLTHLGIEKAIDGHSHLEGYPAHPELVSELEEILDRAGVDKIVNLTLHTYWDDYVRELEDGWLKYDIAPRILNFPTLEWTLDEPGWVEKSCKFLDTVRKLGAKGMKVHKPLGTTVMTNGKVARLTDSRIKEVFGHAGSLGMPIWIHFGDPYQFFRPLDQNERSRELKSFPDWHYFSQGFDEKGYWNLQEDFFQLVENLKGTRFNAVHIANYAWHKLDEYAGILETYPNLFSDMSGRMAELGRGRSAEDNQHRARKTREFFVRCQDKIIWGTDIFPSDKLYKIWSMWLRSDQKDMDYSWASFYPGQGDWLVDGLNLDKPLLEKLCRDNVKRVLGLD